MTSQQKNRRDSQVIRLTPGTHVLLKKLQLAYGHRHVDDTVKYLIDQHKHDLFRLMPVQVEISGTTEGVPTITS